MRKWLLLATGLALLAGVVYLYFSWGSHSLPGWNLQEKRQTVRRRL
jgi:hypothetical protein